MASNKKTKSRGAILGLALTAMLAFGALSAGAAQASPTWSIGGEAFLGEEAFQSKSVAPFSIQFWGAKFECDQSSKGTMLGGDEGSATFTFNNCKTSSGVCTLAPLTTQTTRIDLVEVGGLIYEKFTPASGQYIGTLKVSGAGCSIAGSWLLSGSFASWLSRKQKDASKPVLRFTPEAQGNTGSSLQIGTSPVSLTGESQKWLMGANEGETWGAL